MEEKRLYRERMRGSLESFLLKIKETDLWIAINPGFFNDDLFNKLEAYLEEKRKVLEDYLEENPDFKDSLAPLLAKEEADPFIKELGQLSFLSGVGPMAGVAGAFAKEAGGFLRRQGASQIIVENGGDIYTYGLEDLTVGIYAGKSAFTGKIKLKVKTDKKEFGIASSSGSFGHSLSLGKADLVTIISPHVLLADFFATSFCNMVKKKEDLPVIIDLIKKEKQISGALIIMEDQLAAYGNLEIERS